MKKITYALLSLLFAAPLCSQSIERAVIGSAGGFSTAGSVQLSWTAGETVVNTASAGSVILTQGFQQPESGNNSVVPLDLSRLINVYPNPSYGLFKVAYKSDVAGTQTLQARVYDGAGKLVFEKPVLDLSSGEAQIDLTSLPGGVYTLNFKGANNVSGTFRLTVIK